MKIELEDLLIQKLKTGINLFTGAGFSVLPSLTGEKLPTGIELCKEIQKKFQLEDIPIANGLSYLSEFCPELEFQEFLRSRFTVKSYNPLYDVINKINILSYVTTNIDNIIRLVMDKSNRYYLTNIREYGAPMGGCELPYIPLHGDVTNNESKLYFGDFDLAVVDKNNADLFDCMFVRLAKRPILFLGYSFKDKGVVGVIKKLLDLGTSDIWVQFLPEEKDAIRLYRNKGCHIIESDTESLLKWVQDNIHYEVSVANNNLVSDLRLEKYKIPSMTKVVNIPQAEYFQQGNTGWHPILAGVTYERNIVAEIENSAINNKNIVLTGCRFSGKTTILMQLARKINAKNKFYVDGISKGEAEFITNIIGGESAWIFFNNFTDDIYAYNIFAKNSNITIIGAAEEYYFETVRHLMDPEISYKIFDCSEITKEEAQRIFNKLPVGLRKSVFQYKENNDEKFSMLEMIAQNIVGVYTKKHISNLLDKIARESDELFTIIALVSYLSEFGSALSYSNIARILNIKVYPEAFRLIKKTRSYLRTYDFMLEEDDNNQDYFVLRSKLFALNIQKILVNDYKEKFANIVKTFTMKESMYNIARYNVFRRKAYDAIFFAKIFTKDEAVNLYEMLYKTSESPYILQQMALCLAYFEDYAEAFVQIDKAISVKPNNFSFKNSQAIIMFEANKRIQSIDAIDHMRMAMETLKQCYNNDKRKVYHAQKFAEFAIYLYYNFLIEDYLQEALAWLAEITKESESTTSEINKLKEKITHIMSKL